MQIHHSFSRSGTPRALRNLVTRVTIATPAVAAVVAVAALAALATTLPAQPPGVPGPTGPTRGVQQQGAVVQPTENEGIVTIDFPGGTLAQLVDALRPFASRLNILIPPEAKQVELPGIQLRQVDPMTALKAIETLVDDRGDYVLDVQRLGGERHDVLTVRVRERRTRQEPPAQVRVFSLRWLTTALPTEKSADSAVLSPDTILTAIDTGLGMVGGSKPVLRYHADSGLLFVQGGPQHVDVVQQVLVSLQEDLARRRKAASAEISGGTQPSDRAPTDRSSEPAPAAEKRK